jgi:hypothetical protein
MVVAGVFKRPLKDGTMLKRVVTKATPRSRKRAVLTFPL